MRVRCQADATPLPSGSDAQAIADAADEFHQEELRADVRRVLGLPQETTEDQGLAMQQVFRRWMRTSQAGGLCGVCEVRPPSQNSTCRRCSLVGRRALELGLSRKKGCEKKFQTQQCICATPPLTQPQQKSARSHTHQPQRTSARMGQACTAYAAPERRVWVSSLSVPQLPPGSVLEFAVCQAVPSARTEHAVLQP